MVVEMTDMTKKAPLGIMENIPVKINKFLFRSDFVVIDMLEGPNKTMLLGRPFLATIHAQIDVFRGEISLGIGNEKVEFDTNGEICHSRVCEEDCGIWPTCNPDLSFCSGYDDIYGKEENGMLKQWICFQDHERQNVGGNGMKFDDFIKVRYGNKNIDDLKAGRKRYALEEVWEKCEKCHDSTKQWYDEGFEEEELWQNGIEEIDYTPPLAKNETFKVHRYTFKNGKSFISITKQMNDVLPFGRVNGSRFIEKTRKEMDEEGGATSKT
ncbi:RNA-directed DNA polymerase, eukaryota, reverse transcriptase zinc-binding domain protein [Tanacetum coccineum]|uniref:RNA-directed DNA polymerase, eukaryota, reverse transcriptase zinc-binding domain protein n=1 Tax=Tanacetum coccineum TaxID=301880 RepID=A0ABQ5DQ55_9ASTR